MLTHKVAVSSVAEPILVNLRPSLRIPFLNFRKKALLRVFDSNQNPVIMAPQLTTLEDLAFLHEECDDETGKPRTTFALFDKDDNAYFGSLDIPKRDLKLEQIALALTPVPDEHLFPEWTRSGVGLTKAPEMLPSNIFIKRPSIILYDVFRKHNALSLIPKDLLEEAKVMQMLSQRSHPHIIRYHGCYVRRGRIVGLVLDRHSQELVELLRNKVGTVDKGPFMQALESAIRHLHSLNWAHNDLHPGNILVDQAGMPVLIDFGSAREIGTKLGTSRGTKGWIEGEMKDYHTSDSGHDLFALEKIRLWLDSPTFDNF